MDYDWAFNLYEKHPLLEISFLEGMIPQAKREVDGLCEIFKMHNIHRGKQILDFSCGIGRHSIELVKRNYRVIGYDPSEAFISLAQKRSGSLKKEHKKNIQFIRGRPLQASTVLSNQKFDCAILMGNSFGFVDEKFDILTLRRIAKVLNPGSLIILEVENRDWTLRNFQPYRFRQNKRIHVYETWRIISETSMFESESRYFEVDMEGGRLLRLVLSLNIKLRLYSLHEIIKLLTSAGLSYKASYESIHDLNPVKHQNQDIVVVALRN